MSQQPWNPFYWADYISKTQRLTLEQHGAYVLLMAEYYMTRQPLPVLHSGLHELCRCKTDSERAAVDFILKKFFTLDGDVYHHERIDEELTKTAQAIDLSEKRRKAALQRHHGNSPESCKTAILHHANGHAKTPFCTGQSHPQPQPEEERKNPPLKGKAKGNLPTATELACWLVKDWQIERPDLISGFDGVAIAAEQALLKATDDGADLQAVANKMLEAQRRYFNHPKSKSKYAWHAKSWFADSHFTDDPKAWKTDGNPEETGYQGFDLKHCASYQMAEERKKQSGGSA